MSGPSISTNVLGTNLVLDFASMDQQVVPDFAALYAAGFRVVIFRRSYCYYDAHIGAYHLAHDPTFATMSAAARAAGLVVGAYMFPAFGKGAPSAVEQVANFIAAGGDLIRGTDLPPFLDVEFPGRGIVDTGRTHAEVAALLLEFALELKRVFGVYGIYTSHVQMDDDNGLYGAAKGMQELADAILWQKVPYRIGAGRSLDTQPPREPHDNHAAADSNDYYRVPEPWEGRSDYWITQWQGDVRNLPGGLRQADVGTFLTIRMGSNCSQVLQIKRFLKTLGGGQIGPLDELDPVFDDDLVGAVRQFQRDSHLDDDAIVGPRFIAALSR